MNKRSILWTLILLVAVSCAQRDKNGQLIDTPTSGSIRIAVDESLRPLIDAEIEGFQANYKQAHITPTYTTEQDAIDLMLNDSARLAIVTRKLRPDESQVLKAHKLKEHQVIIAKEGIALIVNRQNADSLITWEQLANVFSGQVKKWNDVYPSSKLGDMQLVFDNPKSGFIRYLSDTLKIKQLPPICSALSSHEAVIDYVSKNKNAIGLIGVSWISDSDDPKANSFLKTIRVMGVKKEDEYFQPYKAYVALKNYPLTRLVTVISREARSGLGSGFIAFTAGDKGQKIALKLGLVPAKAPVRVVQIERKPIQ